MVELASRLHDLHAAQQRHADILSVKKTLELNLDAYARLAFFEVQRCSTAFTAQRQFQRPADSPAVRRRKTAAGDRDGVLEAVRAASERVRKGVEQLAAQAVTPKVPASPRPPPGSGDSHGRPQSARPAPKLRMAQCSTMDVRPTSARAAPTGAISAATAAAAAAAVVATGRSADGLIQVDQGPPRVVRHRPAPPPTWSAANEPRQPPEPLVAPAERLRALAGASEWRSEQVWALQAGFEAELVEGWLPSHCRGIGGGGGGNGRAAEAEAEAEAEGGTATLRSALGALTSPLSRPPAAALAGRLRGLLLLLSAPLAHETPAELAAAVEASLPLWLPQALSSRLLTCTPGQRLLRVVAPAPPHSAAAAPISVADDLWGGAVPFGQGLVGNAAASGRASFAPDARREMRYKAAVDGEVAAGVALLTLPMPSPRRLAMGVWQLQLRESSAPLDAADLGLLDTASRWLRARLHACSLSSARAAHAPLVALGEQQLRLAMAPPAGGVPRPMATGLLLPLLAGLSGVGSVQSWRLEAAGAAGGVLRLVSECVAGSTAVTRPRQPAAAPLSATRHPAVVAIAQRRAVLAAVPSLIDADSTRRDPPASQRRFTLCLPVVALPSDDGAAAAEGCLPRLGPPESLAFAAVDALPDAATRSATIVGVIQLVSRAGCEMGGATCAAAQLLHAQHSRYNELLLRWPSSTASGAPAPAATDGALASRPARTCC